MHAYFVVLSYHALSLSSVFQALVDFFAVRILWFAQTRTWPNHTFQTQVSKSDKMEWVNWAMWFSVGRISGRKESESQSVAWNGWYQEVNAFYTTKGEREKKNDARGPKKVELAGEWASERTAVKLEREVQALRESQGSFFNLWNAWCQCFNSPRISRCLGGKQSIISLKSLSSKIWRKKNGLTDKNTRCRPS